MCAVTLTDTSEACSFLFYFILEFQTLINSFVILYTDRCQLLENRWEKVFLECGITCCLFRSSFLLRFVGHPLFEEFANSSDLRIIRHDSG